MNTILKDKMFFIEQHENIITVLRNPDDPHQMNWIEGTVPWGTVKTPEGITTMVHRNFTPTGAFRETYTFTNETTFPVFTLTGDIGIYTPFNDNYLEAAVCMTSRCHAHIWCGGTSSYVMCLRMGGEPPHLGMVLTKGNLAAYSVERDFTLQSNDRGDFILHPAPFELAAGESIVLEWELFWHKGKDDFYHNLKAYPSYIEVRAKHFVFFEREESGISVNRREDQPDMKLRPCEKSGLHPGEQIFYISGEGVDAWCRTLRLPSLRDLASARCSFIAKKQQYHKPGSSLDGAYLIYDNEEDHVYYDHFIRDHNGGRERIGMGSLIARYLRLWPDAELEQSLKKYTAYVLRELFYTDNGLIFDDIKHSPQVLSKETDKNHPALRDEYHAYEKRLRLYNLPWAATFFLELYGLWKDPAYVYYMAKTLEAYYKMGGSNFYAIDVPMVEPLAVLERMGFTAEHEKLWDCFLEHADTILQNDTNYPAHEVNFEQCIAAPAAYTLFQAYRFSKEEKYLVGAKKQLAILSLFNGRQPDNCLYETAIRHWDGYWFGKRRLYGDTFPHYWSALTGLVYDEYWKAGGGEENRILAEHSIRGALCLILPNGSASCARLYPHSVNGVPANFLDPWANDQDWALYFALRFFAVSKDEVMK
jgi:hypothetical protein